MSVRTITLKPGHMERLRAGGHCWWDDSEGREVLLHMQGARPQDVYPGALVAELAPGDLDLIEEEPEGLVCGAVGGGAGWTVRVAS